MRIKSADPAAHPAITLNYLATDEDLASRGRGAALHAPHHGRESARALRAARNGSRARRSRSDAELERAAGDLGTTIFHPVGTCRMGNDALAVVDDRLRGARHRRACA